MFNDYWDTGFMITGSLIFGLQINTFCQEK